MINNIETPTKMNPQFMLISCVFLVQLTNAYELIYAINAGADGEFIDSNGIQYDWDPLEGEIGTASDYGKQLNIGRVNEHDEPLYQTERYSTESFHYDLPVEGDGEYALTLKFCEVYFNNVNQKVFDVVLNSAHTIVEKLDIFKTVGKGVAHDEIIYFSISRGMLVHENDESRIRNNKVRLEFVKGAFDNPKINAIALFKGKNKNDLVQIPRLQSLDEYFDGVLKDRAQTYEPDEETMRNIRDEPAKQETPKVRKTSGPKQQNPYTLDDSTTMLPIFIAIGAFVPLLICLCKM